MKLFGKCSPIPIFSVSVLILAVFFATFEISATPSLAAQTSLSWTAPTNYAGGASISDFIGYKIHKGTASGNYSQTIDAGAQTNYTDKNLVDGTTYYFAITAYDSFGNESGYSSEVNSAGQVSQPQTSTLYTLAASAGSGGSITPSGSVAISKGLNQSFTLVPNSGYKIAAVTVDGASVGAVSSYTFSNVTANHTISATFSATTASANIPHTGWTLKYADSQELTGQNGAATNAFDGQNGSIWHTQWSNGSTPCPHEIQINLGKSYSIDSFSYLPRQDGGINGNIGKYEFYVSSDGVNWGTAVATGTFANNTTLKQVSLTAKSGQYIRLRALSEVNGGPWTSAAEINVTGTSVTSSVSTYSISATAGTGGSISPAGTATVNAGGSKAYTITPSSGYKIASVTVNGASVGAVTAYTFSNVTTNHTIAAAFSAIVSSYSITASAGTGGSISPAGTSAVTSGGSKAFSITPTTGYKVTGVTVDGASVGAVSTYTFSNVTANRTIAATFSAITVSANIPHTSWTLKYADSQETVGQNGAAKNAFDGQTGTIWHTQWKTITQAYPHEIQINLSKSYSLDSFSYLPRQDGGINGTIAKYEFYVSSDGVNWGTAVATGTFANNTTLKKVSFTAKSGQYIRLRALSEVNGGPWTSAAEINVTGK